MSNLHKFFVLQRCCIPGFRQPPGELPDSRHVNPEYVWGDEGPVNE